MYSVNNPGFSLGSHYGNWGVNYGDVSGDVSTHFGDKPTLRKNKRPKEMPNNVGYYDMVNNSYLDQGDLQDIILRYKKKCEIDKTPPIDTDNLTDKSISHIIEYLKENVNNDIIKKELYHGTIYERFNQFKTTRPAFLSSSPKFAYDYAAQKSMDGGLDADISVGKFEFIGKLINYKDHSAIDKLIDILPDKVEVSAPTMSFMTHDFDKEDMRYALKNIGIEYPIDYIVAAKVGDTVVSPRYKHDEYYIAKKDTEYVYAVNKQTMERYITCASSLGTDDCRTVSWENKKLGFDIQNLKKELILKYLDKKWGTEYDFKFLFMDSKYRDPNIEAVSDEDKKMYLDAYAELTKTVIDKLISQEYYTKYTIKSRKYKMKSNWNYFENNTVMETIKKLGYDGYVAVEDGEDTYCIFKPNKTLKLISWG